MSSCSSDKPACKWMSSESPETVSNSQTVKRLKRTRKGQPRKWCAGHPMFSGEVSGNASEDSPVEEVASCPGLSEIKISRNSSVPRSVFSRVPRVSLVREPLIEKELKLAVSQVFHCPETSPKMVDLGMDDPATSVCAQLSDYQIREPLIKKKLKLSNFESSVKSERGNVITSSHLQPRVVLTREPAIEQELKSRGFKVFRSSDTLPALCNSHTLKKREVNLTATALQPRVMLTRDPAIEQELKLAASKVCGCSESSPEMSNSEVSMKPKTDDPSTSKRETTVAGVPPKRETCITSDSAAPEVGSSSTFSAEAGKLSLEVMNSSKSENCKSSVLRELEIAKVSFPVPKLDKSALTCSVNASISELSEAIAASAAFSESDIHETADLSEVEVTNSESNADACAYSDLRIHETAASSEVERTNFKSNTDACAFSELEIHKTAALSEVEMFNSESKVDASDRPETHKTAALSKVESYDSEPKTAASAPPKIQTDAPAFPEIYETAAPSEVEMFDSKPKADVSNRPEIHETAAPPVLEVFDSEPETAASASPKIHEIDTLSKKKMSDSEPNTNASVVAEIHKPVTPFKMMSYSKPNTNSSACPELHPTELKARNFKTKTVASPALRIHETATPSTVEMTDFQRKTDAPDILPSSESANFASLTSPSEFSTSAVTCSYESCSKPKVNVSIRSKPEIDYPKASVFGEGGLPVSATNSGSESFSKQKANISSSSTSETVRPATITSLGEDKLSVSAMTSSDESRSKLDTNISTSSESETAHRATTTGAEKLFPSAATNFCFILKAGADLSTASELGFATSKTTPNLKPNDFLASAETDSEHSPEPEAIPDLFGWKVDSTVIPNPDQNYFSTQATAKSESLKSKVGAPTSSESEVAHPTTSTTLEQERFSASDEFLSRSKASSPGSCGLEGVQSATTTDLERDKFSTSENCSRNLKSQTIVNPASFPESNITSQATEFKFSSPAVTKISCSTFFRKPSASQFSPSMFKFSKPMTVMASCNVVTSSEDLKRSISAIPKTADFSNSDLDRVSIVKVHGKEMPLKLDNPPIFSLSTVTESEMSQKSKTPVLGSPAFQASPEPVSPPLVSESLSVDLVSSPSKSVTHLFLPKILISDLQNRPPDLTASPETESSLAVEGKSVAAIIGHLSPPKGNVSSTFGAFKPKSLSFEPFAPPKATVRVLPTPKVQNKHLQANNFTSKAVLSKTVDETTVSNLVLQSANTPLGAQVTSSEQILKNLLSDLTRKFRKDDECSCDEPMESSDLMTTDVPYHTITGCVPVDILNEREITNDNLEIPSWRHKIFTSCYSMEGTENLSDDVFEKRHARLEQEEKRRKRWDVQRIREQRQLDHLRENERKRNWLAKSDDENDKERPRPCSLYPTVSAATRISVDESLPVNALGVVLKKVEPREFSLPWKDGNTSCGFSYDVDTSPRTRRK